MQGADLPFCFQKTTPSIRSFPETAREISHVVGRLSRLLHSMFLILIALPSATTIVIVLVSVPPGPFAVRATEPDRPGLTIREPLGSTAPIPSMFTVWAF